MAEVEAAIHEVHAITDKPTLIICKSIIGKGIPHCQGTREVHSDAPGWDEVRVAKIAYGADPDKTFYIPCAHGGRSESALQPLRSPGRRSSKPTGAPIPTAPRSSWTPSRGVFAKQLGERPAHV